jgi:predicted nucleic acid-binding protein
MAKQAVLDACVLFRGMLTDFLLCLAEAGNFDPVWSDEIHVEWMRSLHERRHISHGQITYRRSEMERAFPAANVSPGPDMILRIMALCEQQAEQKDAHVIAAALAAGADIVVTDNTRDMTSVVPRLTVDFHDHLRDMTSVAPRLPSTLNILTPDEFVAELYGSDPAAVIVGTRTHRRSLNFPAYDPANYLALLSGHRVSLPKSSALLAQHMHEL